MCAVPLGTDNSSGPDASDVIGTRSDAAPGEQKTDGIIDLCEIGSSFLDLSPGIVVSISDFLKFVWPSSRFVATHSRDARSRLLEQFKFLLSRRGAREPGIRRPAGSISR